MDDGRGMKRQYEMMRCDGERISAYIREEWHKMAFLLRFKDLDLQRRGSGSLNGK